MVLGLGAALAACGLPAAGLGPSDAGVDASAAEGDIPVLVDGSAGDDVTGDGSSVAEVTTPDAVVDAPAVGDAPSEGSPCIAVDAGILGALSLADFAMAGVAQYDEYGDGFTTLTQAQNNLAGAAWYRQPLPAVSAYDLTWTLREGPGGVAGAGFTFAVLASATAPSATFIGDNGDGMGLRGIPGGATGYAVGLYVYGGIKLELLSMPGFKTVASQTAQGALNDGTQYAVDVSWRAPSSLTATLHGPTAPVTVSSSDPSLASPGPAWFGATASTGPSSDSLNELAAITVTRACQ
jgi:hypothetical protein